MVHHSIPRLCLWALMILAIASVADGQTSIVAGDSEIEESISPRLEALEAEVAMMQSALSCSPAPSCDSVPGTCGSEWDRNGLG